MTARVHTNKPFQFLRIESVVSAAALCFLPMACSAEEALAAPADILGLPEFSLSLDSDYVVRGVSYSDGQTTLGTSMTWDHDSGLYASISGAITKGFDHEPKMRGIMENVGFVHKLNRDVTVDVGASRADYIINTSEKYRINYAELYSGLTYKNLSAYAYYTPSYLGEGPESLYFDVNSVVRAATNLRLAAHVGLLSTLGKWGPDADVRKNADYRLSSVYELGSTEVRLSWTSTSHYYYYPPGIAHRSDAVVVGLSHFF